MQYKWDEIKAKFEQLSDGCAWCEYGDERIIVVRLTDTKYNDIKAWMDLSVKIRTEWEHEQPLFILVDMVDVDFSFSPYARKRGGDMLQIKSDVPTYIAWATRKTFISQLMRSSLIATNRLVRHVTFHLSYERDEAMDWLYEQYAETMLPKQSVS